MTEKANIHEKEIKLKDKSKKELNVDKKTDADDESDKGNNKEISI